jgi:adenosine deaminase
LIRALEPIDGSDLPQAKHSKRANNLAKLKQICSDPSWLCIAMQIDKWCTGLNLCGDKLYVEDVREGISVEGIAFALRMNIHYARAGTLSLWRYSIRTISKKPCELLRDKRVNGYPSLQRQKSLELFIYLVQWEEQSTMSEEQRRQLQNLPKVELHLHLEGMVRPSTLLTLCRKNQRPFPHHFQDGDVYYFETCNEFIYAYHSICQALVQAQDFALVIADVAEYIKRNNILYAEIAWTPFLYLKRGLKFHTIMEVMNEALAAHDVTDRVNFIIDIQRDHGLELGSWIYQQVFATSRDLHIVGVGLTGQEEGFPPSDYQALYRQAQEHSMGITAHAGEYGTVQDIWQCLCALGVKRIGHGICAIHDRKLLDYLVENHIHLEVCPTSNVRLKRVMTYSEHPVRALWQAAVPLGLNSDDPGIFGSDLSDEYSKVMQYCGWSLADILRTLSNSIDAAFLPAERKHTLQQQIDQDWRSIVCPSSV